MATAQGSAKDSDLSSRTGDAKRLGKFPDWLRRWWTLQDIAYDNLKLELPTVQAEFRHVSEELYRKTLPVPVSDRWSARVQALLEHAEQSADTEPDQSWRYTKLAARELLLAEDQAEIDMRAASLLAEAKQKLHGWRGSVIESIVAKRPGSDAPQEYSSRVRKAAALMDGYHDNGFRKLKILRKRLRYLTLMAIVVTAAFSLKFPAILRRFLPNDTSYPDFPAWLVPLLGLMGALFSMLVSTKSVAEDRVPVQQAQAAVLVGRLALGPLAALAAVTLLVSGVISGFQPTYKLAVATALAAGFSERFVVSAINTFTKSD